VRASRPHWAAETAAPTDGRTQMSVVPLTDLLAH